MVHYLSEFSIQSQYFTALLKLLAFKALGISYLRLFYGDTHIVAQSVLCLGQKSCGFEYMRVAFGILKFTTHIDRAYHFAARVGRGEAAFFVDVFGLIGGGGGGGGDSMDTGYFCDFKKSRLSRLIFLIRGVMRCRSRLSILSINSSPLR